MPPAPPLRRRPQTTGFDPLVFWIQHRNKILLLAGLFAVALAAFAHFRIRPPRGATPPPRSFSPRPTTPDGFRKVIAEYPGHGRRGQRAPDARGKAARRKANSTNPRRRCAPSSKNIPSIQLISGAWTSIAANLEAQGKTDEALSTYQKVSTALREHLQRSRRAHGASAPPRSEGQNRRSPADLRAGDDAVSGQRRRAAGGAGNSATEEVAA